MNWKLSKATEGKTVHADDDPPEEVVRWLEEHTDVKVILWNDGEREGIVAWP